jgi:hypothetical protein
VTIAEIVLLGAAAIAIHLLLRPVQRGLEIYLLKKLVGPRRQLRRPIIDVTDFTSHSLHMRKKDDHEHRP